MRMTAKEAAAMRINLPAAAKKSKYKNEKTTINGIKFDSKKEANYYCELLQLQKAGIVESITLQPKFTLQDGYKHENKTIRPIVYKADFIVTYADGHKEVIDVKGKQTDVYKIKKKILLNKYPNINFKEV